MSDLINLKAVIEVDDREFQRGLAKDAESLEKVGKKAKESGDEVQSFGERLKKLDTSSLEKVGRGLSLGVTAPVVAMGVASVKAASDTSESLSKVGVVFGQNAKQIEDWSKTSAKAMGMSRQEALESSGTLGNLFTAMGLGGKQAADMSTSLVQLAADLGSFNNVDAKEAMLALRSGLVGESEPLRKFGVNLSEATRKTQALKMGLISTTKDALDPAIKSQAAYALIMEQTKTAQGDYARTSDGLANSTKSLEADFADLRAEVGTELLPLAKDAVHTGKELIETFRGLPDPLKETALAVAGVTAVVGPLLLGVTGLVNAAKTLVGLPAAVKGLGGVLGLGGKTAAAAAPAAEAAAVNAYGYSAADLAVMQGGKAAVASTGLKGLLGKALPFLGHLRGDNSSIRIIGSQVAQQLGLAKDPTSLPGMDQATEAEVKARWKKENDGLSPHQALLKVQAPGVAAAANAKAILTDEDKAKFAKAKDAEFDAQLNVAKAQLAAGDESTKNQREARELAPILEARRQDLLKQAEALKPKIGEDADAAQRYWALQKEATNLQEQNAGMQRDAAKEIAANRKKAAETAKQAQREQFALHNQALDNYVLQARAQSAAKGEGEDGDPNLRAIRENELMRPVLEAKQQDLVTQARALVAEGKRDPETLREYQQLQTDYWTLEAQKGTLAANAARAEKAQQKKAGAEALKAFHAELQISKDEAVAKASEAAPGQEARALALELIPELQKEQDQLAADLGNYKEGSEDYWKTIGEISKSKREVAKLEQNAAKEAVNEQKRAVAETHKAARERQSLMTAEAQLAELQLKNNPLLSQRQRTRAMIPLLLEQYREAMRPIQGETRVESVQRQIGGEQLRGQLLESLKGLGIGRRGMMVAMGQLNAVAGQAQADPYLARAATADARQVANTAAAGQPMVFQIVLDPNASPQQQYAQFQEMTRRASREAGFIGPAGG